MEINQLKYFKAVADSGKITSAAKELFISPAAISSSIVALEQELNIELFHRTGNRLTLNRQGKIFLDYANYILESVADARNDLKESLTDRKKNIVVGATSSGIFSDLFCDFCALHPDIPLTTSGIPLRYINSAGLNSRFSFLFSAEPETPDAYADACEKIKLFVDRPALMVHPDHPFAQKEKISMEDLSGQVLIWSRTNHGMRDMLFKEFSSRYITPPIISNQDIQTSYSLVKKNLGIALMTEHSQNTLTKGLLFIPIDLPNCSCNQMLYWKKDHIFSEEDRIFLNFVKEYYSLT